MGNPISKYERIELLVCIYEISRELVFNYGISECSRRLTLVTTVNPLPSQVQFEKIHLPVELSHSSTGIGMMLRIGEPPLKIYLQQKTNCTVCYISPHEERHVKCWGIEILVLPEVSPYCRSWKYIKWLSQTYMDYEQYGA